MFRYLAFFWDDAHGAAKALIERCGTWRTVVSAPGFAFLCAGSTPTARARVLIGAGGSVRGVVAGDLFRGTSRVIDFNSEDSERIYQSAGRLLAREYWGNYVAFVRDAEALWIFRAPAATLPCLGTRIDGVDIYFSWTEACAALAPAKFSINWPMAARSLLGLLPSSETSITEIREILPAHCEQTRGTWRNVSRYWDPIEIARGEAVTRPEVLHDVAKGCIQAWASGEPHILHALSGGLDSSIVLGCMDPASAVTCLNHFAPGPDSDERSFARLAAQAARRRLIEREQISDIDLRSALHGVRFENSPGMRTPAIDRTEPDMARDVGASVISKGHGGDELFCRHHTHFYVADFLRDHGLRPDVLGLLMHSAFTEGETIWTILARAARDAWLPRRWDMTRLFAEEQGEQSLLLADVSMRRGPTRHPVRHRDDAIDRIDPLAQRMPVQHRELSAEEYTTRDCPPGKLWQISLLTGRRYHYLPSMREGDPGLISPLLSQPLIETCLRIPTYLQIRGRRERAFARAAFVSEVPKPILDRRWKGGSEQLAWRMFRHNLPFIRELLLDGRFVRERIVDRAKLEALLDGSPASVVRATVPVFQLIGAEAWLDAWVSLRSSVAKTPQNAVVTEST